MLLLLCSFYISRGKNIWCNIPFQQRLSAEGWNRFVKRDLVWRLPPVAAWRHTCASTDGAFVRSRNCFPFVSPSPPSCPRPRTRWPPDALIAMDCKEPNFGRSRKKKASSPIKLSGPHSPESKLLAFSSSSFILRNGHILKWNLHLARLGYYTAPEITARATI